MAENQTQRWEFYAVRYAMGTVVDAIALLLLARNFPTTLVRRLRSDRLDTWCVTM